MYLRHETGEIGEKLAVKYLEKNDYNVIERNFESKQGEIDIIAIDKNKNELVFIEVKTRANFKYGKPVDAVTEIKRKHMLRTIEYYLYSRNLENEYIRIDVIEVYIFKRNYKINHIKQII